MKLVILRNRCLLILFAGIKILNPSTGVVGIAVNGRNRKLMTSLLVLSIDNLYLRATIRQWSCAKTMTTVIYWRTRQHYLEALEIMMRRTTISTPCQSSINPRVNYALTLSTAGQVTRLRLRLPRLRLPRLRLPRLRLPRRRLRRLPPLPPRLPRLPLKL